tara:strand:+ start:630 stop:818 length:189 start_codon:yes stop_codon:yes gene_type:complete
MAKRRKNRKKTIAQLLKEIEEVKDRSEFRLAFALGRFKGGAMTNRNCKRAKDTKNHWSKDWD